MSNIFGGTLKALTPPFESSTGKTTRQGNTNGRAVGRMELAKHIKEQRARLGMSQEALAEAVFVSRQTISNWETDRTYPDVQSLLLLSALFDTTVDELIKGDVSKMEETCKHDWALMQRLAIEMTIFAILGIAAFFAAFQELRANWGWHSAPTFVLAVVLYGIAFALAVWCDRIKKSHDLVTYSEIVAFSNGEPVDRASKRGLSARKNRVIEAVVKVALGASVGAILGIIVYNAFDAMA